MHDTGYVSAHAFYQGDLDTLIVQGLPGILDDLRGRRLVDDFFFLRYWDGGTHLRLRVRPGPDTERRLVEDLITSRFSEFFARSPANHTMSQEEYGALAASLAEWEGVPSHVEQLYPNNSVALIPYQPEHERYGRGASLAAAERHFGDSSRIALAMLARGLSPDERTTAAASMIMLAWFSVEPDPGRLRRAITVSRYTDTLLGKEKDLVQRGHGQVVRLARHMFALSAHAPGLRNDGLLVRWARSAATLVDELAAEVASGAFSPPSRGWEGSEAASTIEPRLRVLPVIDICAHLLCNRLGVSIAEEAVIRVRLLNALETLSMEDVT
ncbi:lantibiotic dehydratase C-terminal domain-containing protein [Actinokineospora cianjurensis]|uniref:Thiopeptide-type bacteriocin biosynthesis protein n=1 Tax=Actinokineospora cianjurensis TaxID=585224 RepID=A0A421B551_9PSEU|nr:lantibiotic dehydratase C-terminal domain-containing protein [Actinokineospora cianjurensis]RLK59479.1 thiopeptide-type bacteriocin biosynthesis protein [Actinokineospora cianjurensis]